MVSNLITVSPTEQSDSKVFENWKRQLTNANKLEQNTNDLYFLIFEWLICWLLFVVGIFRRHFWRLCVCDCLHSDILKLFLLFILFLFLFVADLFCAMIASLDDMYNKFNSISIRRSVENICDHRRWKQNIHIKPNDSKIFFFSRFDEFLSKWIGDGMLTIRKISLALFVFNFSFFFVAPTANNVHKYWGFLT